MHQGWCIGLISIFHCFSYPGFKVVEIILQVADCNESNGLQLTLHHLQNIRNKSECWKKNIEKSALKLLGIHENPNLNILNMHKSEYPCPNASTQKRRNYNVQHAGSYSVGLQRLHVELLIM